MVVINFSGILGVSLYHGPLNLTTQRLYTKEIGKHHMSESHPHILGSSHHLTALGEETNNSVWPPGWANSTWIATVRVRLQSDVL